MNVYKAVDLATPQPQQLTRFSSASSYEPLVAMSQKARVLVLWILGGYTLLIVVGGLLLREPTIESYTYALSQAVLALVTAYPFISRTLAYWANPLVLGSLLWIFNSILRGTAINLLGMHHHLALPGYSTDEFLELLAYRNLLSAFSLIGLYFGFCRLPRFRVPHFVPPKRTRIIQGVALSFCVAILGLLLMVRLSGNFDEHLSNIFRGSGAQIYEKEVAGLGPYGFLMQFAFVGTIVWIASDFRKRVVVPQLVGVVISVSLLFLAAGRRASIIFAVMIILVLMILRRRKVPGLFAGTLLIPLLIIAGLVSNLRSTIAESGSIFNSDTQRPLSEYMSEAFRELESRATENSSALAVFALVPKEFDLLMGEGYFGHLTKLVPRAIWPSKPIGVDALAGQLFFNVPWSIPPGAVAEAYWNFHIPGVIIVFLLFGMFLRWFVDLLCANPMHPAAMSIYVLTILTFNPSQTGFTGWYLSIIPALGILWFAGLLRRAKQANL